MKEILLTLFSLTLSGSLLCVFLLLLRPVIQNRAPKAFSYYLWLAVLLRFLVPLGYGVSLPQPPQPAREIVQQETSLSDRQDRGDTQTAPIVSPSETVTVKPPETAQPSVPAFSLPGVLVFLLLTVGAGFFLWHLAAYIRFSRRVRASLAPPVAEALALFEQMSHGRVRLAQSGQVDAPMLLGVLRPVIVLPRDGPSLHPQALSAALRHELTHARRWDICYKWLVVLVTSLHWFNPLVHWMGRRIALDCELSCDEAVIRSMEPTQRMAYGDLLLMLAAQPKKAAPWMAAPLCQEGKRLKARLLGIKGYRRPGKAAICLTLVLGLAVACCACGMVDLRQPQTQPSPDPEPAAETDPYASLLDRYEDALSLSWEMSEYRLEHWPDLPNILINPYWYWQPEDPTERLLDRVGYVRRDLDGDGSEELLLGWVGNDIWNLDQGYVFAIYTLVDGRPVLAVEGWERSLYVVREDNILCHSGSSGAGRTTWSQYRFDPSAEGYLALSDHVSEPEDGDEAWTIGEGWMASGVSLSYIRFADRGKSPYQDVLLGKTSFLYVDGSSQARSILLSEVPALFSPYSSYAAVSEFAVLDLDGDGKQEVVLQVTDVANDMGGYLILHQDGDEVYGYPSGRRTFWALKTDGTFTYSSSTGMEEGVAAVRFEAEGLVMDKQVIWATEDWEAITYEVEQQPVSQTQYEAAIAAQAQKPDAVWYELNEANIQQLTA